MAATTAHPIQIRRRTDSDGVGVSERTLRALVRSGDVRRVAAGCYALNSDWKRLTPMQRHFTKVLEVADRSRSPQVFMGAAAAAA